MIADEAHHLNSEFKTGKKNTRDDGNNNSWSTTKNKILQSNKDNILLEVSSKNAPGDQWGNNYSNESRVGEGYAKTGKSLAKLILKKAF